MDAERPPQRRPGSVAAGDPVSVRDDSLSVRDDSLSVGTSPRSDGRLLGPEAADRSGESTQDPRQGVRQGPVGDTPQDTRRDRAEEAAWRRRWVFARVARSARVSPIARVGDVWWLVPFLLMALGAALGVQDIASPQASGWLRVPALIAALLLVAQGLLDYENGRRVRDALNNAPDRADLLVEGHADGSHTLVDPGRAHRGGSDAVQVAGSGVRESPGVIYGVIGLAVWLGLATLAFPGAPRLLLGLSLLAAFLLFASGWGMLQERED